MIERLGETDAVLTVDDTFRESSLISRNPGQMNARHHGKNAG
ncbi:MAG TPA: hypothetical protein VMS64_05755 [Candidatus Methylomirabilis sp.]|nr:hypothetical protein [Candidatus Methylomirabilis sp.]